jgi:hypothetical protein
MSLADTPGNDIPRVFRAALAAGRLAARAAYALLLSDDGPPGPADVPAGRPRRIHDLGARRGPRPRQQEGPASPSERRLQKSLGGLLNQEFCDQFWQALCRKDKPFSDLRVSENLAHFFGLADDLEGPRLVQGKLVRGGYIPEAEPAWTDLAASAAQAGTGPVSRCNIHAPSSTQWAVQLFLEVRETLRQHGRQPGRGERGDEGGVELPDLETPDPIYEEMLGRRLSNEEKIVRRMARAGRLLPRWLEIRGALEPLKSRLPEQGQVLAAIDAEFALATAQFRKAEAVGGTPANRLRLDDETRTVFLDGAQYPVGDSKAYSVYKAIASKKGDPITKTEIGQSVRGVQGEKTIPRLLSKLP